MLWFSQVNPDYTNTYVFDNDFPALLPGGPDPRNSFFFYTLDILLKLHFSVWKPKKQQQQKKTKTLPLE